eukprot:scaffold47238_cov72-Phaeocystis_antarctica.AAC.6
MARGERCAVRLLWRGGDKFSGVKKREQKIKYRGPTAPCFEPLARLDPALPSAAAAHRVWRRTAAVAARRPVPARRRRRAAPARAAAGGRLGSLLGKASARHAEEEEPLRRTLELPVRALVLLRARLLQVRGLAAVLSLEVSLPPREPSHELRLLDAERLQGLPRVLALATARAAARGTAPTARGDADAAGGAASGAAGGGSAAGGAVALAPASAVLRGRGEEAA